MGKNLTYQELINEYSDFLGQDIPEMDVRRKSFLECSGLNYKELVNSNILQFYFDPIEEHGFGDLFLKSLLSFLDEDKRLDVEDKFENVTIVREDPTDSGRIDLSIYGYIEGIDDLQSAIIIENKIYHHFENNPFDDYWDKVTEIEDKYKVGVFLTLRDEIAPKNFINITHSQLVKRVMKDVGSVISQCDDRHLLFLKDYKLTIDNLTEIPKMKDSVKFIYENGEKISELEDLKNEVFDKIKKQANNSLVDINNQGHHYKFQSSNIYSFSLTSYTDGFIMKHHVSFRKIFVKKQIRIYTFSSIKDHPKFTEYFNNNREKYKYFDPTGEFNLDNTDTDSWRGSVIYGQHSVENISVEQVSDFGDFFKVIFIKKIIPFENKIREEYKKFKNSIK